MSRFTDLANSIIDASANAWAATKRNTTEPLARRLADGATAVDKAEVKLSEFIVQHIGPIGGVSVIGGMVMTYIGAKYSNTAEPDILMALVSLGLMISALGLACLGVHVMNSRAEWKARQKRRDTSSV